MTENKIFVVSAIVKFQGIQLEDGRTLAVEMSEPKQCFAVIYQSNEALEALSLLLHEADAVKACQTLAIDIEMLAARESTLQ